MYIYASTSTRRSASSARLVSFTHLTFDSVGPPQGEAPRREGNNFFWPENQTVPTRWSTRVSIPVKSAGDPQIWGVT